MQYHCAIIACMLISMRPGKKPAVQILDKICWYFCGMADKEELLAHLDAAPGRDLPSGSANYDIYLLDPSSSAEAESLTDISDDGIDTWSFVGQTMIDTNVISLNTPGAAWVSSDTELGARRESSKRSLKSAGFPEGQDRYVECMLNVC